MLNRLYFIFVLSLLPYRLWANDEMLFIKNEGQWTPEVQYKADLTIGSFILEKDKLSFLLNNLGHTHTINE
jgi:ABC-type microcin C transport system permease subunit YejE